MWTIKSLIIISTTVFLVAWGPLSIQPPPGLLQIQLVYAEGNESAYTLSLDQLVSLGSTTEAVYIPYIEKTLKAEVLPLRKLLELNTRQGVDTLIAYCYDGYIAYFPADYIAQYEPYLVMSLSGREPGNLNLDGSPELGPFYITMTARPEAGSRDLPDPDNKRPFGVFRIEIGSEQALLGPLSRVSMPQLTLQLKQGREYWLNNCMSCHAWNKDGFGGILSNRTAEVLAIHARFNKNYFHNYIKDPTTMITDVKMPKHPHYDYEAIESIRAFLRQQF
jgi:cytochrome c2